MLHLQKKRLFSLNNDLRFFGWTGEGGREGRRFIELQKHLLLAFTSFEKSAEFFLYFFFGGGEEFVDFDI